MGGQPSTVPQNFAETCHTGLKMAKMNNNKLEIEIDKSPLSISWYNSIIPYLNHKSYLFLPLSIQQSSNASNLLTCGQDYLPQNFGKYIIQYDCYIYNLRQQVIARKQTGHFFMEWQVWKILRKCAKALYEWKNAFPNKYIGKITPNNMIMNNKGNIKLVHNLSFAINPSTAQIENYQHIYTRDSKTYVLLQQQKYGQSQLELAIAMLQITTMQQAPLSTLSIFQKIFVLKQAIQYSQTLKNLILALIQNSPNQKPSLNQILQISKQQSEGLKKSEINKIKI